MSPFRPLVFLAALSLGPAGAPLAAPPPSPAAPGWTVVRKTRVRLRGRLLLRDGSAPPATASLDRALEPGRPSALAVSLGERDPVRVGLLATAEPLASNGRIRLRLEADVQPAGASPVRAARVIELDPGRAGLVELWADPPGRRRLVAVLSATAEQVPRLERVTPATRPVDLLVEVLGGSGSRQKVLDRLRLSALVGSPARYGLASLPPGAGRDIDPDIRVELELVPAALRDGLLDLRVRVTVRRNPRQERDDGPGPAAGGADRARVLVSEASTSGRVAPGGSVELPLPRGAGGERVTFRVTAFF